MLQLQPCRSCITQVLRCRNARPLLQKHGCLVSTVRFRDMKCSCSSEQEEQRSKEEDGKIPTSTGIAKLAAQVVASPLFYLVAGQCSDARTNTHTHPQTHTHTYIHTHAHTYTRSRMTLAEGLLNPTLPVYTFCPPL